MFAFARSFSFAHSSSSSHLYFSYSINFTKPNTNIHHFNLHRGCPFVIISRSYVLCAKSKSTNECKRTRSEQEKKTLQLFCVEIYAFWFAHKRTKRWGKGKHLYTYFEYMKITETTALNRKSNSNWILLNSTCSTSSFCFFFTSSSYYYFLFAFRYGAEIHTSTIQLRSIERSEDD